jgi:hypothetical protein
MPRALIISSDGHAAPDLSAYKPYMSPSVRGDLDELIADSSKRVHVNFFDTMDPKVAEPYRKMMYDSGTIEGKWNVEHRLQSLSNEGILGEVIFPDGAPFGAGALGSARTRYPRHLELEGGRAYNRWLVDYVSGHQERFAAQAIVSLADIDEAVKDVYWAAEHGMKGIVILSAGGNLAAVVALRARDAGGPELAAQVLIYPVTDYDLETTSYVDPANELLLTRESMEWFWGHYISDPAGRLHPEASPLRADVAGVAPAIVLTAERDVLRDEGEKYAAALEAAGVPVRSRRFAGQMHGFFSMVGILPGHEDGVRYVAQEQDQLFHQPRREE